MRLFSLLFLLLCLSSAALADGILIPHPPISLPRPAPFGIRYHHVEVSINEGVAQTKIDQVFTNSNRVDLEATYLFPIPESASLSEFAMWIDGTRQEAELREADAARRVYEDIVRRMQDPALLEYAGRNLFKARVYPVPANGEKRIALGYQQVLERRAGTYEYIYPLDTEKFSATPIQSVRVTVTIETQRPLRNIWSPSHDIEIDRQSETRAVVSFEATNVRPNKEFALYYSTTEQGLGVSALSYRRDGQPGYFLLSLDPAAAAAADVLPRDIVFAVDVSGSMAGEKLRQAQNALRGALNGLRDDDRFTIITFASSVNAWHDRLQRAGDGRGAALTYVDGLTARGGTNIAGALQRAASCFDTATAPRLPLLVFVTDGQPTVGEQSAEKLLAAAGTSLPANIRLFSFGVGFDVNTTLLDGLAQDRRGRAGYIRPHDNLEEKVSALTAMLADPLLLDATLRLADAGAFDVEPAALTDLYGGEQMVVAGRYRHSGEQVVTVRGTGRDGATAIESGITLTENGVRHDFVARIWAQRRIGTLLAAIRRNGESAELKEEVVGLAKEFGLVTPYTSYLVLEPGMTEQARRDRDEFRALSAANAPAPAAAPATTMADGRNLGSASGEGAVNASRGIDQYQQGFKVDDELQGNAVRIIAGRQFTYRGGVWQESGLVDTAAMAEIVTVTIGSDAYFALARDRDTAKIMALGPRVIFRAAGTVYCTKPEH